VFRVFVIVHISSNPGNLKTEVLELKNA
jgi:hypothetical protein